MGSAWAGDWAARIENFARREGFDHICGYLFAHPAIPLREIADRIGDAAPIQIEKIALDWCLSNRHVGRFIRDQIARNVNYHVPAGARVISSSKAWHFVSARAGVSLMTHFLVQ